MSENIIGLFQTVKIRNDDTEVIRLLRLKLRLFFGVCPAVFESGELIIVSEFFLNFRQFSGRFRIHIAFKPAFVIDMSDHDAGRGKKNEIGQSPGIDFRLNHAARRKYVRNEVNCQTDDVVNGAAYDTGRNDQHKCDHTGGPYIRLADRNADAGEEDGKKHEVD